LPVKNKGLGGDMRLSMMQICKLIFLIKKTEERGEKRNLGKKIQANPIKICKEGVQMQLGLVRWCPTHGNSII
jgi:hypothetical protein